MSYEAAVAFRQKVNESPELQAALRSHMNPVDHPFVVSLGQKNGFDFTDADSEKLYASLSSSQDSELSDFELEMVAGGAAQGSVNPNKEGV
jgi:predicted ribosomally synthesized peptide with nif11-like leader